MPDPRRFRLVRHVDVTGISGTGVVADGVLWPDGTVTIRWRGGMPSTVNWERLDHAHAVHGHGGATRIEWLDDQPASGGDPR
jgi:hypothetical protein